MADVDFIPFQLEPSWQNALQDELRKSYIIELAAFVEAERLSGVPIYPSRNLVFNAFQQTPFDKVKVVIVGQDPYHGPGQAHGLCFSVPVGVPIPPSLKNIYKELMDDVGIPFPTHGCLLSWAQQGVMLLNATLTVSEGNPLSHHGRGWETFTDAAIKALVRREDPVIFVLWGKSAQDKCRFLRQEGTPSRHYILTAAHPSPFSAYQGFLGCRHFSQINGILTKLGKTPIDWTIC